MLHFFSMKWYRKFKKRHRVLHILIVAIAVVMFWRGIWQILDIYLFPGNQFISSAACILIAFLVLYLDDFHLKELE